jgi:hypothetical protein
MRGRDEKIALLALIAFAAWERTRQPSSNCERSSDRHTAEFNSCPTTAMFFVAQAVESGFGSSHRCAWPGQCRQMRG